ncbi:MAG TPA: FlgO family outer membrane protein [Planctomycetaceae bacterium]|nr:FlgO family outer membrane protein [Planctomycetaceae bacterium]
MTGDLEVTLEVGDEVEKTREQVRVAVCPIYDEDGTLTNIGATMSEDITTDLVQRKVPVVERSVLGTVLPELLVQNTALFDSKTAQRLGQLAGASVVVTGKIVPVNKTGTAYIRMVDVESGKILFAASSPISLAKAARVGSTPVGGSGSSKEIVKLTDEAPANWMISTVRRGVKIWWDKPYAIAALPKEMSDGKILIRSVGQAEDWIEPSALTATRAGIVYAVVRSKYLKKTTVADVVFTQFERDGWERLEDPVKSTFPPGEDWQWVALKKQLPAGDVIISLQNVNWGSRVPVFFVFK